MVVCVSPSLLSSGETVELVASSRHYISTSIDYSGFLREFCSHIESDRVGTRYLPTYTYYILRYLESTYGMRVSIEAILR